MRIGCPTEIKPQEFRVGLTPNAAQEAVGHGHEVLVQSGAGLGAGFDDAAYEAAGARIVATAQEVFAGADMIVKVKEPQAAERAMLREGQVLFTYLHLAPDPDQTRDLMASGATCIAYETVTDRAGGLPLLAPMSEVAGRLAPQMGAWTLQKANGGRGVLMGGVPGVGPARVVVIGGGVVGTQAARIAAGMGAEVTVLDRSLPRLRALDDLFGGTFRTGYSSTGLIEDLLPQADLVIGAVLIPGAAAPKLVRRAHFAMMKPGAVLVDVAIDQGGCFETSETHHPSGSDLRGGRDPALLCGQHARRRGAHRDAGLGQRHHAVHAGARRQGLETRLRRGSASSGGAERACRAADLCGRGRRPRDRDRPPGSAPLRRMATCPGRARRKIRWTGPAPSHSL